MSTEKSEQVEITIDDKALKVPKGTNVLAAAGMAGIYIPTLCNHPELKPNGSCRVCIVEVSRPDKNPDKTYVVSACVYPASEGLRVRTNVPAVLDERKQTIQSYLEKAPESPSLKALAGYAGVSLNAAAKGNGASYCIACGKCVRVCSQLIGANAIGIDKKAKTEADPFPFMNEGSPCIGCTACAYVCPTGVIEWVIKDEKLTNSRWGVELDMMFCPDCGEPVGTVANMKRVQSTTTVTEKRLARCPTCRRKMTNEAKAVLH